MSSYLNLYLRTKEKNDKKSEDLLLMSFSRNSEVYSYINEELPNLYSPERQLKEITTTSISNIIRELEETLKEQHELYQVYKDCKEAQSAIETKKYITFRCNSNTMKYRYNKETKEVQDGTYHKVIKGLFIEQ